MLREFTWKVFEKTGEVDTYMFYKEIQESNKLLGERKVAEEEVAISN